jgi:hypothetical protein
LSALVADLAGRLPPPSHGAAEVRRLARGVLARPEFTGPAPSLLERARGWVLARLAELFGGVLGDGGPRPVGWVVVGAVAVGAVLLTRRARRALSADPGVPAGPARRPKDAAAWRAEAAAHEAAGAWREALRCRYRALVAELVARGALDDVPGRTTGEERDALARSAPAAAAPFAVVAELFERAWYGAEPVGPGELRRVRDLEAAVVGGAGR